MNLEYLAAAALVAVFAGILIHQKRNKKEPDLPEAPPEDIHDPAHYDHLVARIRQLRKALEIGLPAAEQQQVLSQLSALTQKYEDDRKEAFPNGGGPKPIDDALGL